MPARGTRAGEAEVWSVLRSSVGLATQERRNIEQILLQAIVADIIADGALGEAAPAHTLDAETIGLQMAGISTDATDAA